MEILKLIVMNEVVAQLVSFLILLFVLKGLLWKKFLGLLDARKERIAGELREIEQSRAQVQALQTDYEARLTRINDTAQRKIVEALSEGRKITDEVRKKAYLEAQGIIENARRNVRYELSVAKQKLKEEIVGLTLDAAEDLIQEKLTEEQDRVLVRKFLEKIDEVEVKKP